jgi:Carboxypeptidase regulatory-like domain
MGTTAGRVLTAMAAAALLAAGCSARSFDQVRGTVLDARTHRPVARAAVTSTAPGAVEVTATTDAQGRFTLRNLSRHARLRVTAGNYWPAQVQPTGELVGVALSPIPVRGVVRSTLTGGGLRATVAGAGIGIGRTEAAADGSFRLYGLGPGDKLTVTAPGYKTASATIGTDRNVRVALAAEEATRVRQVNQWLRAGDFASVWRYVFQTPTGYGYVDLPADFKAEVRRQYVGAIGSTARSVRGFEMRSVTEGDAGADIEVLAFAMDPEFAALPGFRDGLVAGFTRNTGVRPRPLVLPGGTTAAYFRPPGGAAALLLSEGSLVVLLFGPPEEPIKRFAAAFLAARQ